MKANKKQKAELLQELLSGTKAPNNLMKKTLAKTYLEFSNNPGQYQTIAGEPRTKEQIEEECLHFVPCIVQVVVPEGAPLRIAESEDEIEL